MKLYVVINGVKHYIDEDIVKKYGIKEVDITPWTRLKVCKE